MMHSRFKILLAPAFGAALLAGCASQRNSKPVRSVPDEKKTVLLIQNFTNNTPEGQRWDPWKLGIPSLLEDDLLSAGYFALVSDESRRMALKEIALGQTGLTDNPQAVGKLLGAKWILAGEFTIVEPQMTLKAKFIEVQSARVLASVSQSGAVSSFFSVGKAVSEGLMRQVKIDLTDEEFRLITAAVETKNVEASLANYSGEFGLEELEMARAMKGAGKSVNDYERKIAGLREKAKDDFRNAVRFDPGYERAKKNLGKLTLMFPSSI